MLDEDFAQCLIEASCSQLESLSRITHNFYQISAIVSLQADDQCNKYFLNKGHQMRVLTLIIAI